MKKLISLTLLGSLFIPGLTFAQVTVPQPDTEKKLHRTNDSTTRPKTNESSTKELGFCAQIDKALVNIDTKSTNAEEKRTENKMKKDEKRLTTRTEVDTKRDENETKRKAQLDELTKRATTKEQKAAVTAFTNAMDKALLDKKTATDANITAHRKDVDQATVTRKAAFDKALATLKADTEVAKTKAKTDCANKVAGDTVRKNLKDDIKKAQEAFKTTMQSLQKDTLQTKNDTKKAELQAVEETFKKAVDQARKDLKAALKTQPLVTDTKTAN